MNMTDTLKDSYFAEVFPKGWDIEKIADCVSQPPESVTQPQPFWNPAFRPVACENLEEFGAYMGHEIAMQIRRTKEEGRKLILILPVGPMGMYKWAVYFLKEWNVDCKHVYGFNMDEWSDAAGNTLPASDPAAFQNAMVNAFYGPLGELTVPEEQRNFATKENLPTYAEKIAALSRCWSTASVGCAISRSGSRILPMNMKPRKHGWQSRAALGQDSTHSPSSRMPSRPSAPRGHSSLAMRIPSARRSSSARTTPSAARTACCRAVCSGRA